MLVRAADGVILASDDNHSMLQAVFPGFDSVQNAIERERRGDWVIPEIRREGAVVEPARVVGFSPVDQVQELHLHEEHVPVALRRTGTEG